VSTGGEAGRDDAAGLRGRELLPGRAGAAWCGPGPGGMQDLPHRGCCDRVAGPGGFALHPPVPPRGIIGRDADHELADGGRRRRPPGTPAAGVVPCACGQPPVPGVQRRRGHRGYLAPPAAGNQSRQCRQPQPAARLAADPADLAAEHRVLVPEHQEPGIRVTRALLQAPALTTLTARRRSPAPRSAPVSSPAPG
jgi:hypothetical protein